MRTFYLIIITSGLALLTSCTSTRTTTQMAANFINRQTIVTTTKETYPPKNPKHIALYTNEHKPLTPYRIIGVATISKHNFFGGKRQAETLNSMMKNLAASIGGDALIQTNVNNETIKVNIIQFQRILL